MKITIYKASNHGRWIIVLAFVLLSLSAFAQKTVYITRTGEKYHLNSCQYLRQSKIEINADSARQLGYTPCAVCKPSATRSGGESVMKESSPQAASSSQCTAKTKSGTRCSRQTRESNGRCWQHQ